MGHEEKRNPGDKEGLSEEVTFEQRPKRSERMVFGCLRDESDKQRD